MYRYTFWLWFVPVNVVWATLFWLAWDSSRYAAFQAEVAHKRSMRLEEQSVALGLKLKKASEKLETAVRDAQHLQEKYDAAEQQLRQYTGEIETIKLELSTLSQKVEELQKQPRPKKRR